MLTNATITIFNKFPDREGRRFVYVPHVLKDVWFHTDQKTAVADSGLASADSYKIRIPYPCEGWLPPNDYRDLASLASKLDGTEWRLFLGRRVERWKRVWN